MSIRTIKPSPFGDGRIYYGGYDNDFHPADGAGMGRLFDIGFPPPRGQSRCYGGMTSPRVSDDREDDGGTSMSGGTA